MPTAWDVIRRYIGLSADVPLRKLRHRPSQMGRCEKEFLATDEMLTGGWLFPGRNPVNPMTARQLNRIYHGAEVAADILRAHGQAWRSALAGHVSLGQLKVMSAIEHCRAAALGGHVMACEKCDHIHIACSNKAQIYGILFKATAETLVTIAADPRHLGAKIGIPAVLHTRGSTLTHHPHVHCIVPGGSISILADRTEIDAFAAEMIDRFGPLPEELEYLLRVVAIKRLCKTAHVATVDAGPKCCVVSFHEHSFLKPAGLVGVMGTVRGKIITCPNANLDFSHH